MMRAAVAVGLSLLLAQSSLGQYQFKGALPHSVSGGGAGPTVVHHVMCNTNPGTTTITCGTMAVTAGNMEVVIVADNCGAGTDVSTISGNVNGSLTLLGSQFNSNGTLCSYGFYKNNISSSGTETFTVTWTASGAIQVGIELFELTGQNSSTPFDNGAAACLGQGSAASTSWATSSCTVTGSADLLIGLAWQGANLVTTSAGSGFTSLDAIGAATTNGSGVGESKASVAASQTITATSSNSTNAWVIQGYAIK